jgi:epoxyqueuosine reductase
MPPILNQSELILQISADAKALGFSALGVSTTDLSHAEAGLLDWLKAGFHGEMAYMQQHGLMRARPAELLPGTISVITVEMPYLPRTTTSRWIEQEWQNLESPNQAVISVYARGRDYHKVIRARLQRLKDQIAMRLGPFGGRVFTDSAPVLEVALSTQSGLGWRGKHTLQISRTTGSMVFLGEILTDLALAPTEPVGNHCGSCQRCLEVCPTQAIVAPYQLDARRCISYLTIEHSGPIPVELRPALGNRIYGCDDCQLICPWNKFAVPSVLADFDERPPFVHASLADLMAWKEADFLNFTTGSPIRRIGFERWQRNVAVACGNALAGPMPDSEKGSLMSVLQSALRHCSPLVAEHIAWALDQLPGTTKPDSLKKPTQTAG